MSLVGHIRRGVILLCLSLPANAGDPSAVFNDAKAYAQDTVDGTGGIVGAEKAATLPHYTTTSPVPGLVPGSVGLGGAGAGKIQGCQGQNDTECAAVNFLSKNPDSRLRFNLDPVGGRIVQAWTVFLDTAGNYWTGSSWTTSGGFSTSAAPGIWLSTNSSLGGGLTLIYTAGGNPDGPRTHRRGQASPSSPIRGSEAARRPT